MKRHTQLLSWREKGFYTALNKLRSQSCVLPTEKNLSYSRHEYIESSTELFLELRNAWMMVKD